MCSALLENAATLASWSLPVLLLFVLFVRRWCRAMRPAVRPLSICISEPLLHAFSARSRIAARPFVHRTAARCISSHNYSGTVFTVEQHPSSRNIQRRPFIYNTRRWQSNTDHSAERTATPKASPDDSVEERLRRVQEEYTFRELEARQAASKAESLKAARAASLKKSQEVSVPKPEPAPPPPDPPPSSVDVPPPPDPQTEPPPPPLAKPIENPKPENDIKSSIPQETLPSYAFLNRSEIAARFNVTMERLMARATVASQRLNTYTGTDYSGIAALRNEIMAQEQEVKTSLRSVDEAKDAYTAAFAAQANSQKEVVQLLERKHSWAATDLERYMALIRSEHLNEQAVQKAKEDLSQKERALEDTRARLERLERRQYHEEQIWSDTIRRNSTWITFGLMGFNVVLLLFTILLFEPWRRWRLVREFRKALDEKLVTPTNAAITTAGSMTATSEVQSPVQQQIEAAIDTTVSPTSKTVEHIVATTPEPRQPMEILSVDASGLEAILTEPEHASATTEMIGDLMISEPPYPSSDTATSRPDVSATSTTAGGPPPMAPFTIPFFWAETWAATWALYKEYWSELFSERQVAVRCVDLTATALEGAAAGAAFMGLLLVLLRPR